MKWALYGFRENFTHFRTALTYLCKKVLFSDSSCIHMYKDNAGMEKDGQRDVCTTFFQCSHSLGQTSSFMPYSKHHLQSSTEHQLERTSKHKGWWRGIERGESYDVFKRVQEPFCLRKLQWFLVQDLKSRLQQVPEQATTVGVTSPSNGVNCQGGQHSLNWQEGSHSTETPWKICLASQPVYFPKTLT